MREWKDFASFFNNNKKVRQKSMYNEEHKEVLVAIKAFN